MRLLVALLAAYTACSMLPLTAQAHEPSACTYVAANNGRDDADGSVEAPVRTVTKLYSLLAPGDTGCLRAGRYGSPKAVLNLRTSGRKGAPIILTSFPGERATLRGRVVVWGSFQRLERLQMQISNVGRVPSSILGDHVVLRGNDISGDAICLNIGHSPYRADHIRIEGNRIHHCGRHNNHEHALYVENARDVEIVGNWIYRNADRGVQLYPHAVNVTVAGNVLDRNGEGVLFGALGRRTSHHNRVMFNAITNSTVRDNVESYYGSADRVGYANRVHDNCVSGGKYDDGDGGIMRSAAGFRAYSNLLRQPRYVAPARADYRIRNGDPCGDMVSRGLKLTAATAPAP